MPDHRPARHCRQSRWLSRRDFFGTSRRSPYTIAQRKARSTSPRRRFEPARALVATRTGPGGALRRYRRATGLWRRSREAPRSRASLLRVASPREKTSKMPSACIARMATAPRMDCRNLERSACRAGPSSRLGPGILHSTRGSRRCAPTLVPRRKYHLRSITDNRRTSPSSLTSPLHPSPTPDAP